MTPSGRPAEPEVIWARPQRAGRGPRPAHSRDSIAAEAVRIADAEGIEAVSMRRVAAGIGAGTMSLYNYVPRKEDLYELMVDAVSGEYELTPPTGDWRADLLALARQTRALMHRHPWLPRLLSPVYGFSPNALRYLEHSLRCLAPLEVPDGDKLELIASVNGTVATFVDGELALAERARQLPWSEAAEQGVRMAWLGSRLATGEYPLLAGALTAWPGIPAELGEVFDRSLTRLLGAWG
ncbi:MULTISPECIES: TetR/AcrR family transcriptional regulator [unclassified Streptomyces]|uniref:TetR/AcrR family transcriptional regulator n=1 Tax=unclassified Streptomyces TaxID=2593676 RepID=UPI001BEA07B3|nr:MULTISPECIES: TetR/AcrR family transcriptional regulator C-terminal domain-containing protein [unclassified Streptomyces]MBT2408736.1 TetR/AcrR family transcriptional regulator C-terminal domain-containing protein [Streptomyces sp. ISL-21]MBT2455212.1 TetR/AcrR family transcriptional regulator C-terminal domain-containing protein [Streptomyces sp. ISL-86]MBT2612479.1 TetR/AcrR family transcriptional regulator C-terminal domain-containing protein [Streptomyces sp. ISL-87]